MPNKMQMSVTSMQKFRVERTSVTSFLSLALCVLRSAFTSSVFISMRSTSGVCLSSSSAMSTLMPLRSLSPLEISSRLSSWYFFSARHSCSNARESSDFSWNLELCCTSAALMPAARSASCVSVSRAGFRGLSALVNRAFRPSGTLWICCSRLSIMSSRTSTSAFFRPFPFFESFASFGTSTVSSAFFARRSSAFMVATVARSGSSRTASAFSWSARRSSSSVMYATPKASSGRGLPSFSASRFFFSSLVSYLSYLFRIATTRVSASALDIPPARTRPPPLPRISAGRERTRPRGARAPARPGAAQEPDRGPPTNLCAAKDEDRRGGGGGQI